MTPIEKQMNETNAIISNVMGIPNARNTALIAILHNRFMFIADKGYTADEVHEQVNKSYDCTQREISTAMADLYIQGVIKPTKESRQGVVFKLWPYVGEKDV